MTEVQNVKASLEVIFLFSSDLLSIVTQQLKNSPSLNEKIMKINPLWSVISNSQVNV